MNSLQDRAVSFLSIQAIQETNAIEHDESAVIGRSLIPRVRKAPKVVSNASVASGQAGSGSNVKNDSTSLQGAAIDPPAPDPIDARAFIVGMRKADRQQGIRLIHAYMGNYNTAQDFGTQELIARTKANRELSNRPLLAASGKDLSNAFRSFSGYTSGLPDHTAKRLSNLQAQERETVTERAERNKTYQDERLSWEERLLAKGLFDLAGERLASIRDDMARLRF